MIFSESELSFSDSEVSEERISESETLPYEIDMVRYLDL
jgi:hypothetical protein